MVDLKKINIILEPDKLILSDSERGVDLVLTKEEIKEIIGKGIAEKLDKIYKKETPKNIPPKNFVFIFHDRNATKFWMNQLSNDDVALYMMLISMIDNNNVLSNETGESYTIEQIAKELGGSISKKRVREFLQKMIDIEFLYQNPEKEEYAIPNEFCRRGALKFTKEERERGNIAFCRFYSAAYRRLFYLTKPQSRRMLGHIFRYIPYLHYHTNLICSKPAGEDVYASSPFSSTKFASVVGYGATQSSNLRDKLTGENQILSEVFHYVPVETYKGERECYFINPYLLFKGNTQIQSKDFEEAVQLGKFESFSWMKNEN